MAELDAQSFRLADATSECDLGDLRREVPRQLCELLIQGLNTNREQRPSSVADFRASLERIQGMFTEAVEIERELWGLSDVLLQLLRGISLDADYANKEEKNVPKQDHSSVARSGTMIHTHVLNRSIATYFPCKTHNAVWIKYQDTPSCACNGG